MYQVTKDSLNEKNNEWLKDRKDVTILDSWDLADPNRVVIAPSNLLHAPVRHWMNNKQSAMYIGRGYLGNHLYKTRKWWRYSINGWANIKLENIPYSRWQLLNLPKHPWKVKNVKNVLIAPSKMTSPVWDKDLGFTWAEHTATKFPGAEVKIRYKEKTPGLRWATLWKELDWADLVVTQSSAITCEAFWYGKKVISIYPCPTWAAERTTLEDWQNPKKPELRDVWHEHLAWSQFTTNEWISGEAFNIIEKYVGVINLYRHLYDYDF
jgi:hypothetical protein